MPYGTPCGQDLQDPGGSTKLPDYVPYFMYHFLFLIII
jgi:hypothetical protein